MTTTPEAVQRLPDRVELLYTLADGGRDAMAIAAAEMGMTYRPRRSRSTEVAEERAERSTRASEAVKSPAPMPEAIELAPVCFWRPVAREYRESLDGHEYPRADPSTDEAVQLEDLESDGRAPRHEPIVSWPRLWRALDDRLRTPRSRRAVDVDRLVRCWARGEAVRTIPRRTGMAHAAVTVVLDRSDRLMPFWVDQQILLARLARRLGRRAVRRVGANQLLEGRLPQIAADERVLALTDFGGFASSTTRAAWMQLGAHLSRRSSVAPLALVTAPPARWPRGVTHHWRVVEWENPNHRRRSAADSDSDRIDTMLPCLAMAQRLEAGLVRAIRRRVGASLGAEVALWRHPDVVEPNLTSLVLDPVAAKGWRREFSSLSPDLQAAVLHLFETWHREVPEIFAAEVAGLLASGVGPDVVDEATAEPAIGLLARICRRVARHRDDDRELDLGADGYFGRLGQWASLDFWRASHLRADLDRAVQAHRRRYPEAELPTDMTPESLATDGPGDSTVERWQIVQRNEGLTVEQGSRIGSSVAEITTRDASIVLADGLGPTASLAPGVGRPVESTASVHVTTDVETVTLEPWQPILDDATSWASAAGRDEYGLWAAFDVDGVRQRMRWIPPGRFWTGSPDDEVGRWDDEGPRHPVSLTEGYWLAETPCTQALWRAVMGESPSRFDGDERPVESVSWDACQRFLDQLNERFRHLDARLPTEAEWEYACRAGTDTATWLGDLPSDEGAHFQTEIAWFDQNSDGETHPVGTKLANPWGLYDMLGNVEEWCWDRWRSRHAAEAETDPEGPEQGSGRVFRGGSWSGLARGVRAASRLWLRPGDRSSSLGFRLSRGRGPVRGAEREPGSADAQAARRGTSQRAGLRRSRAWIERLGWAHDGGTDAFGRWASFTVDGVETRLRWMVPGTFWMGSPEDEAGRWSAEGPRHEVTLTEGFWIGETPCTQALWEAVTNSNPSRFRSPRRPVETVSWDDAQEFLAALGERVSGLEPRLPTEAWWEYACRAGTATATWQGDLEILGERNAPLLDEIAWYGGNSGVGFDLPEGHNATHWKEVQYPRRLAGTREVALKRPNPWGLHDMLGNVFEWCSDRWADAYLEGPQTDPTGPDQGAKRVLRGGSWRGHARRVRAASRYWRHPGARDPNLGFRLSRGRGS